MPSRTRDDVRPILRPVPNEPAAAQRNHRPGLRVWSIFVVLALAAGVLVWRLTMLQVVDPDRYVSYGLDQRLRTIDLPGGRGDLLDRNGEQLATSLPRTTFFADPSFVVDASGAANALAPILGMPSDDLYSRLTADSSFSYLARQVDDEVAAAVHELNLEGVFSLEEPARFKPAGERLAAGVLGRVGIDSQGLSGLEYSLEQSLVGLPGEIVLERDQDGHTIPHGQREVKAAEPGADVVLTLDRSLQFEVERLLLDQVEAMGANGGVVVVTEPATGEVLAMAGVERDAAGVAQISVENMALTWVFEPGSVIKPLTFAAVLDTGLANPQTTVTVPDRIEIYDREFSDIERHEPERWSVSEIVTRSSNVGTILWAQALGAKAFDAAMRAFGFGSTTGLGLPGETSGLLRDLEDYTGTTVAASTLGQAIAVSPAQMLAAYNVIANDGYYVPLRLVREVIAPDGSVSVPPEAATRAVISPAAARESRGILRDVVGFGTGTAAQIEGYEVAGKTGTARKPQPEGGYLDAQGNFHYVSSFVGFLPANDPQISILVAIDDPTTSIYASVAAAPAFADIARYGLRHFQIPPAPPLVVAADSTGNVQSNFTPTPVNDVAEGLTGEVAASQEPGQ